MKEKIYLLPGLMTDQRLWSRLLPFLDEYELVHVPIPDTKNFDDSIDVLLDTFKEEKVNILGFSLGGYIASYFAVKHPSRVNKLFLVAATPGASSEAEIQRRKAKFTVIEENGFEGIPYEKAQSLVEEQNKNDEELLSIIQNMFMDLGKETFITQLTSTFHRKDLFEDLCNLTLPIYFYYSKKDRFLNQQSLKRLREDNHNMTVVSRDGNGHNIPLEVPKELSIEIKKWMSI